MKDWASREAQACGWDDTANRDRTGGYRCLDLEISWVYQLTKDIYNKKTISTEAQRIEYLSVKSPWFWRFKSNLNDCVPSDFKLVRVNRQLEKMGNQGTKQDFKQPLGDG